MNSLRGATLLWLGFLIVPTLTLPSPRPSHRLEARQALASITSSIASSTPSASLDAALAAIVGGISAGAAAARNASSHTTVSTAADARNANNHTTVSTSTTSVPMVNVPLLLPSLSGCTPGDTSTVTFTSEFPHHTGFETVAEDQEFWNDTGTVWVIKVVSPGYWVQDLGLFNGNESDPEDASAITLGPSSTEIAIKVPTHGCLSKHPVSSCQY